MEALLKFVMLPAEQSSQPPSVIILRDVSFIITVHFLFLLKLALNVVEENSVTVHLYVK